VIPCHPVRHVSSRSGEAGFLHFTRLVCVMLSGGNSSVTLKWKKDFMPEMCTSSVEVYDPQTNSWTAGPSLANALCGAGQLPTHSDDDDDTHTHTFNVPLSGTTRVSRYQKGKTNLDFTEARDSEWQWHPLGRMQVCTSLQTDNHANTSPLSF